MRTGYVYRLHEWGTSKEAIEKKTEDTSSFDVVAEDFEDFAAKFGC